MRDESFTISQIFDKVLKRILLALSPAAVINLINGMFSEDFPPDSAIDYNCTENIDSNLAKTVADIIITLRSQGRVRRFHMEGQINDDDTIVIRVFEYGFHDALRHQVTKGNRITLPFPAPVIIFLEHSETTPDEVILELDFGERGKMDYPVPIIKFLTYSVEELRQKKMVILLPLYLLKLRREVENAKRRRHGREAALKQCAIKLKELINTNLLPVIVESERAGDITYGDTFELLRLFDRLYGYLYGGIEEFKNEEVVYMLADTLVLKYDVELAEAKAQVAAQVTAQVTAQVKAQAEAEHKEQMRKIARNLKAKGFSYNDIAEITGLSYYEAEQA